MGLPPLEYSDCFLDSPSFREIIALYEQELEGNTRVVKNLVKECDNMIQKTEEFSRVQQSFSHALSQFRFQTIGTEQTEDEMMIGNSLQCFAKLLLSIEDYRHNMLNAIRVRLLKTLENFRKEHMKKTLEEKKRFDDASRKYYTFLDSFLSTKPPKKKDAVPTLAVSETDHFEREKAQFRQISFDYVVHLQDVHAQKHFELVEPIIGYVSDVTTFLHQAYEEACNIRPQIEAVQVKVQLLRETHESEQEKAYHLKAQVIEEGQQGLVHHPEFVKQGLVTILDKKRGIGNHWQRYYCQFRKMEGKKMVKFICSQKSTSTPVDEWMEVRDCVRSKAEEVDRRFCFDIVCLLKGTEYKITVQGIGQEDRNAWLHVMEGREPVYTSLKALDTGKINPVGFKFIERCLDTIEERGLDEEGLYRRPGVLAKANKLIKECVEKDMTDSIAFNDEIEWDTKTLASAVKLYFGKYLGEPIMTFNLHSYFIDAAKINDLEKRSEAIKELVDKLPKANGDLLATLIAHLKNVADMAGKNLMKASNLGVCFGPTLMRPEHETVASIVDIRYQNIIVEYMILHVDEIFPGVQANRPFPRPKNFRPDSNVFSRSEPVRIPSNRRRPPPAAPAPTKRVSAAEYMKKSYEQRTQSTTTPHNAAVSPLVSNKDIPPPPVTQRQPVASTPPSYTAAAHKDERSSVLESGAIDHLEAKSTSRPPVTQKRPNLSSRTSQYLSNNRSGRTESSPPAPPPQEQKPVLSRRSPPSPPPTKRGAPTGRRAKALYDCDAEDDVELSFHEDEILYHITESDEPEWLFASNADGKRGLIPANYIQWLSDS